MTIVAIHFQTWLAGMMSVKAHTPMTAIIEKATLTTTNC
jgi:hypothetical protein